MTIIKQDWSKLQDTVAGGTIAQALWYMTGNEETPRYSVPAIPYSFEVSKRGIWAGVFHKYHRTVYRWWHKRANGVYMNG
jgi:hypothetical protein